MQGTVQKLFIRDKSNQVCIEKMFLLAEVGIERDVKSSLFSPCHVLLADKEVMDSHESAYGALNENICVRNFNTSILKQGNIISIGSVKLKVMYPNEPCNIVASHIKKDRGILATVIQGGEVNVGDEVILFSDCFQQIPQNRTDLFSYFVKSIPPGRVVSYREVIVAIGGKKSHLRVIPGFIKKGLKNSLPVHRIVDSSGNLLIKYLPDQADLLEKEGIQVCQNKRVDLTKYKWSPEKNVYADI